MSMNNIYRFKIFIPLKVTNLEYLLRLSSHWYNNQRFRTRRFVSINRPSSFNTIKNACCNSFYIIIGPKFLINTILIVRLITEYVNYFTTCTWLWMTTNCCHSVLATWYYRAVGFWYSQTKISAIKYLLSH